MSHGHQLPLVYPIPICTFSVFFSEYELRVVDNVTINEEQPGSWKPFHPFNLFDKYFIIYFIEVHPALRSQYKY